MSIAMDYSNTLKPSCRPNYRRRRYWAGIFADAIRETRQDLGLSVEDIAKLAGMETSEWAAIEAGYVPIRTARLRSMAGALEVRYDRLIMLVLFCRDAWEL